ncbi:DUF5719 family protein [Nocardioides pantholopis]|uniref:DUF5719 family protein n=1 Tax=Nocardioides pantholopis TaxID=2483798 RepID=UPI000FD7123E|nr:DUF5719 family protein [Nocardioides pantholopis]
MSGRRQAPAAPRRRSERARGGRPDLLVVLAVLVPLLAVVLVLLGGGDPAGRPDTPASDSALTRTTLVCPSAREDARSRVLVATTEPASGAVRAGRGEQETTLDLRPERTASVTDPDTVPVTGEGDLAPGLVASRVETGPLAAADCLPGAARAWFTGVGAGARHSSVLELANEGSGQAVVDVRVLGAGGPVEADDLLGVVVRGGETVRVDLSRTVPRRDELALEVTTTRGRISATVLDQVDRLGRSEPSRDWLASQAEPDVRNVLLGLPGRAPERELVLANGGADEVRADVRLLSADSVFRPEGLDEVRVPPGGVTRVSLAGVLAAAEDEGVAGVQVDSTGPLTATLRSVSGGDLTSTVAGATVGEVSALLVPAGPKSLVLGNADAVGVVEVTARDGAGKVLATERVEMAPDRASTVDLPRRAVQVVVDPRRTTVSGSVLVTGDGVATLSLRELDRAARVPDVRPGLP